ncbi:hypothetical protein [Treponema brennaborense]|uniref:Outer membrane protein beta-barrel domain-containing protein n=1 Tax=Treponema brennaborense (strain DSM 12168 / CIP 105900 / DD5/3) TaxID=906968 RepID=F4LQD2_TREBD|nr:hypothetical protein [Treponema brennaborense]AEE16153.1 hypothetical protein Trebr_0711 [Treponema brennaborense DSM 12168]
MKRIYACIICILGVSAAAWSSASDRIIFSGSVGTAAVFYGDSSRTDMASGFNRFVPEADVFFGFMLDPAIRFSVGMVSVCDFHVKDGAHCNYIDYAFFSGVRIYPGLAGLCVAVEYAVGRRTDFIDAGTPLDGIRSTQWGNGFRLLLEYDFSAGGIGFAPVLGGGWRRMPRGDSADNILSLYFRIAYR